MATQLKFLPLVSVVLVGLGAMASPIQLLAQSAPIAEVWEGKIDVKRDKKISENKSSPYALRKTDLIRVKRDTKVTKVKVRIRCTSNKVVRTIPADGLFRGVREFCR